MRTSSKPEESVSKHAENHGNQEAQRGVGHHSSDRILPDLAGSRQSSVEVISTCIYCVFFFYLSLFEDVLKMPLLCFAKNISKAKFQCFPNLQLCNISKLKSLNMRHTEILEGNAPWAHEGV